MKKIFLNRLKVAFATACFVCSFGVLIICCADQNAGSTFTFCATTGSTVTSMNWTTSPKVGVTLYPNGNTCDIYFSSLSQNNTFKVTATATNQCGQISASHSITIGPYSGEYK